MRSFSPTSISRRRWLQIGAVGLTGLHSGRSTRAASARGPAPVRACILVFYQGGPSHLDTWDMKPDAPAEVRGQFRPIATAVPGLMACEHLPYLARVADRLSIIRSVHHRLTNHLPAAFATLIGHDPLRGDQLFVGQGINDPPSLGSSISHARSAGHSGVPPFVALPHRMWNEMDVVHDPYQLTGYASLRADPQQSSCGSAFFVDSDRFREGGKRASQHATEGCPMHRQVKSAGFRCNGRRSRPRAAAAGMEPRAIQTPTLASYRLLITDSDEPSGRPDRRTAARSLSPARRVQSPRSRHLRSFLYS